MDKKKQAFLLLILRRGTYKWKPRNEALKASKVARNSYVCTKCGPKKTYPNKLKQLDHVHPVQRIDDVDDGLEAKADRMYPDTKEGFQVLCIPHHKEKSSWEKTMRAEARKLRKKEEAHKLLNSQDVTILSRRSETRTRSKK